MDNYLQNTLGVGNAALRARLMTHGFTDDLESLSRRDKEFACKVATAIRKQGGVPATHMSVDLEDDLEHLVSWAIYTQDHWTLEMPLGSTLQQLAPGRLNCQARMKQLFLKSSPLSPGLSLCWKT